MQAEVPYFMQTEVPYFMRAVIPRRLLLAVAGFFVALAGIIPASGTPVHVEFVYQDDVARSVALAGSFNSWSPTSLPFRKTGSETWACSVALEPGIHEYKFVLDGKRYISDPRNARLGGSNANSVLEFAEPGEIPSNFKRGVVRHEFIIPDREYQNVSLTGEFARWNNNQYQLRLDPRISAWRGVYYVPPGMTDLGVIADGEWQSPKIGDDPGRFFIDIRDGSRRRIDQGRFTSPMSISSDRADIVFFLLPPENTAVPRRACRVKVFRDNAPAPFSFDEATGEIRIPLENISGMTTVCAYAECGDAKTLPAILHIVRTEPTSPVVPIARVAGAAYPGESLTIDARQSHASGARIMSYRWESVDGAVIASPSSAITTFSARTAGTYSLRLEVTDEHGRRESKITLIKIEDPPAGIVKHLFRVNERAFDASGAVTSVAVAGTFNNWSTATGAMKRGRDGSWELSVWLPAGEHEYKFVVDGTMWVADPGNSQQRGAYGNSVIVVGPSDGGRARQDGARDGAHPRLGDAIIYQIMVPRFCDSDGDGIGDLDGLTSRLDYIRSLGVTWIYLLPIFQSPNQHGYTTTDYYTIDPRLGSIEDFDELIAGAHARGMRVMLDYVFNHSSADHPFFSISMRNPHSMYRTWHKWTGERSWEGFGGSNTTLPGWNFENREVRTYGIDVARYWLRRGIDGFRCDVAHAVPDDFWAEWAAALRAIKPDVLLFPEFNEPHFDLYYDFSLMNLGEVLSGGSIDKLDGILNMDAGSGRTAVRFLDYHDKDRARSAFDGNRAKNMLGALLLFTSPGVPMVYYGAEAGMEGRMSENTNREMMEWLHPDASMTEFYRAAMHLRNAHPALRIGSIRRLLVFGSDRVYAFMRQSPEERVIALFNCDERPAVVTLDLGQIGIAFRAAHVIFGSATSSVSSGTIEIRLAPYEGAVLELN